MATGGAKKIQGDVALLKKLIPLAEGERWITGGEAGDEVCLPRLNSTFGGVPAVDMRRNALEGDIVFGEGLFDIVGAFVVDDV